jgi:hypothetical protein
MLITVAAIVIACGWLGPLDATAGHISKDCGVLSHRSHDYRIHAAHLKCKAARRASLKYLKKEKPRRGFDCAPTAGHSFYCQDPPKSYSGIRL